MPSVSVAMSLRIQNLISQQPKEKQEVLYKLYKLQEKYKCSFFGKKKIKEEIDKLYPKYPKEAKLLESFYKG